MAATGRGCDESSLEAATRSSDSGPEGVAYRCQATRLLAATRPLRWWDLRQYLADLRSGNVRLGELMQTAAFALFHRLVRLGLGYRILVGLYDRLQRSRGGTPYPFKPGRLPADAPTPLEDLGLRPGELVRVKPHEQILATLNSRNRNRGLYFDSEMVPYCGGTYRVLRRVERIIDERTGRMREMKAPCIVLDGVVCRSRYSEGRLFCPRAIYSYWREGWLERAGPTAGEDAPPAVRG